MRALIIKMSSMGDIIHALPALADAKQAMPTMTFDWCVEEGFSQIPGLSTHVDRVIPIALRRWRKSPWQAIRSGEWRRFWRLLRQEHYQIIVDVQGLLKSAIVARLSHGTVVGFDRQALREPVAGFLYHRRFAVPDEQHEVQRMRRLFASMLNYSVPESEADFGMDRSMLPAHSVSGRYLVFIHAASWDNKLWPEAYWIALSESAHQAGYSVQLPWGSEKERERAERIASQCQNAQCLPKATITELASVIADAAGVVGVDTGLTYLAGALRVPTVQLYGPTESGRVAILGEKQKQISAEFSCAPCMKRSCTYEKKVDLFPACLAVVTPEIVWKTISGML